MLTLKKDAVDVDAYVYVDVYLYVDADAVSCTPKACILSLCPDTDL